MLTTLLNGDKVCDSVCKSLAVIEADIISDKLELQQQDATVGDDGS
jgi:hypothetical protein